MQEDKLHNFVNSSGFPLQIGIQNHIEKTYSDHGWKVVLKEFPWRSADTGKDGFVDLVLRNRYDTFTLIVECKRVRDTSWVFLQPLKKEMDERRATFWLSDGDRKLGWYEGALDPVSSESEFCVVPGQDPKSKPLLERMAAELLEATETIALEEYQLHKNDSRFFYFPVIVTTAELKVCAFSPDDICVEKGELAKSEFQRVPFVRFRKTLTTKPQSYSGLKDMRAVAKAKERTVFVMDSVSVVPFLKELNLLGSLETIRRLTGP